MSTQVWRRKWLRRTLAILIVFSVVLVALPYGVKWGLQRWLINHGAVSAEIGNVDFNPFAGRLAIYSLQASRKGEQKLVVEQAVIDIGILPLREKRVWMQDIRLQDVRVKVQRNQAGEWTFGGLKLTPAKAEKKPKAVDGWGVGIGEVDLKNVRLDYRDPKIANQVLIRSAHLDALQSWNPEKSGNFHLRLTVEGAPIEVQGSAVPFGDNPAISANVRIDGLPLGWLNPLFAERVGVKDFAGRLDVKGNLDLRTGAPDADAKGVRLDWVGTLALESLGVSLPQVKIEEDNLSWEGKASLNPGSEETFGWQLAGRLTGGNLELMDQEHGRSALRLGGLTLGDFELIGGDVFRADELTFRNLDALEMEGEGRENHPKFVVQLAGLNVGELQLEGRRLKTRAVRLDGLNVFLERNPQGAIELGGWLTAPADEPKKKAAPKPAQTDNKGLDKDLPPWSYAVDSVKISGKSRLVFLDRTVAPQYRWVLDPLAASIENLDSARPKEQADLELDATPEAGASLHVSGTVAPFAYPPAMDLKGQIKALELPPLSPYVAKYTGYKVQQGHLDLALEWPVKAGKLDGNLDLTLKRFRVDKAEAQEGGALTNQLDMPLPIALDLLRDGDGDIELHIPVSGNLTSPDFRIRGVIVSAVAKALQKSVMSYYAPLGATLVTGGATLPVSAGLVAARKLFEMATTIRFKPVTFSPGSSDFDKSGEQQMKNIVERLGKRPEVRLALCGIATPGDLTAARETVAAEKPEAGSVPESEDQTRVGEAEDISSSTTAEISDAERQMLLQLARERTNAVKAELVELGIDQERLFFCAPKIQEEQGPPPRVEISI